MYNSLKMTLYFFRLLYDMICSHFPACTNLPDEPAFSYVPQFVPPVFVCCCCCCCFCFLIPLIKSSLCYSYIFRHMNFYWNADDLPEAMLLNKTDSPSLRSCQLSITPWSGVRLYVHHPPSLF